LSQFKKYHPSRNLKFNYLGIFQSLKLRILMDFFLISPKLNFPQNTLGGYGLIHGHGSVKLPNSGWEAVCSFHAWIFNPDILGKSM